MSKSLKYLIISCLGSFLFFFGINLMEKGLNSFFYSQALADQPMILLAQVSPEQGVGKIEPSASSSEFSLEAKSGISIAIDSWGKEKVLFEKNSQEKLPIASLSKLMTALVVLDNYDLDKEITVSKEAVAQEENFGKLSAGDVLSVKYLLFPLLMESSNDAAYSLANDYPGMREKSFVELMNDKALKLGLENTSFINSTGLDPETGTEINLSTAKDLSKLTKKLLGRPLIWQILSTPKYSLYGPELINTNKLLTDSVEWKDKIMGGKTGYTDKAGGCLILFLKAPQNPEFLIINVILGTKDEASRFEQVKKLVNWLNVSYEW
jgi:D-alanyl-D-alanine carboxypeptidase